MPVRGQGSAGFEAVGSVAVRTFTAHQTSVQATRTAQSMDGHHVNAMAGDGSGVPHDHFADYDELPDGHFYDPDAEYEPDPEYAATLAPDAARLQSGSTVEGTECWTPSEHLIDDPASAPASVWRVLCRVHYRLADTARYTDVVCIGDFDKQPMLDHCYIWKPHLGNPTFEDGPKLASPAPPPHP